MRLVTLKEVSIMNIVRRRRVVVAIILISAITLISLWYLSILKTIFQEVMSLYMQFFLYLKSISVDLHNVVVSILVMGTSMSIIYYLIKFMLKLIIPRIGGRDADVKMISKLVKSLLVIVALMILINHFYRIEALMLALGAFTGLFLGWALQQPITGIAAWIFINIKRPFRIGDRIYIPRLGLVGDVIDVGVFHTVLNQVGGTVGSEEASGRIILIPNAIFFTTTIINYTYTKEDAYILDEIVVRLSYDSDIDLAEKILVKAAKEVTKEIVQKVGIEPYVRMELWDYGILVRLRYYTLAKERVRTSHEITRRIIKEFQREKKIDFAIPFVYSYRAGRKLKYFIEK